VNGYEDAVASAVGHLPAATLAGIATAIACGEPVPASWAGPDTDRLAALIGSAAAYRAGEHTCIPTPVVST